MAILNAGQVAPEQAGLLFDIALREPSLQAIGANRSADLDHGLGPIRSQPGKKGCVGNRIDVNLRVNTLEWRTQANFLRLSGHASPPRVFESVALGCK